MKKYERIGISGGTFDPIHCGHLIMAEEIRQKFNLDRVIFIPTGMPPHKVTAKVTEAEHRFSMVFDAIRSNPFFKALRTEIDRKGYTYTVDTLLQLRAIFGTEVKMFFITGADVVGDLLNWKDYEKVFSLCEFIAAFRPGNKRDGFIKQIEYINNNYHTHIHTADVPLIDISSTLVRERIRNNQSIKYLVPECVEKYILDNRLYR
ncbi:MAG: nicotinate-nucleotide adenylyltransferase [Clostridia bacterium]|nr:nicotinate-nucleotide adenylyltransferase [Clostridia bacterium]